MKLTKTDALYYGRAPRGEYARIVDEFVKSDMECAEVEDLHVGVETAYRSFMLNIKKFEAPVRVVKSADKLYLVKDE